ncbi:MAG TPA: prepilin-type N-terminal cleavage/methylation domain-containing protein [Candidatus Eisenbacteria bacterium]|nr:prepilin-type N-terminal cleavage/methylation domain-containing protein [Candidatus Eisenbacteria bacterium]
MNGCRMELWAGEKRASGFSLTELVVALAVGLILMGIAMPSFLHAYRSYQLSNAATEVADIIRLTRYEAIRLNKPVNCVFQPDPGDPTMTRASLTDKNGTPLTGVSAKTIMLGSYGTLIDSGSVPGAAALPAAAALGATIPVSVPAAGATLQFDPRGALASGNVDVFFLNSPSAPDAGYRAVLLMPAGSLQIWTGDSTGSWQQLR